MNREIKFRVWDIEERKMHINEDKGQEWLMWKMQFAECIENNVDSIHLLNRYDINKVKYITEMEIMQYTGLKDKNGKEIYEGDIVEQSFSVDGEKDWVLLLIKFNDFSDCGFREIASKKGHIYDIRMNRPERFKIIGNKFENPELLGEEND